MSDILAFPACIANPENRPNAFGAFARSRNNHFGALRTLAALLVIFSHSYALTGLYDDEPAKRATVSFTFGSLAVYIFFTISGFLIMKSWLESPSIIEYFRKRAARIFPGLAIACLFAVFIVGPMTTSMPLTQYFANHKTWSYLWNNVSLVRLQYPLPGVFATQPVTTAVNGSLWSLPIEIYLYILVPLLALVGHKCGRLGKHLLPGLFVALLVIEWQWLALRQNRGLVLAGLEAESTVLCALHFLAGAIYFVYRWPIAKSGTFAMLAAAGFVASWKTPLCSFVELATLPYLVFYAAYVPLPIRSRWNNWGDPSYGLYVFAFPIQQWIIHLFPKIAPLPLFATALAPTTLLALLSWHLVEKQALQWARRPNRSGEQLAVELVKLKRVRA